MNAVVKEQTTQQGRRRNYLSGLAQHIGVPAGIVTGLPDGEIDAVWTQSGKAISQDLLGTYLLTLAGDRARHKAKVPPDWTAKAMCGHCGPVWLDPDVAASLPVVDGLPFCLGCPWCHQDLPLGARPALPAGKCRCFVPDAVNPRAGLGKCRCKLGSRFPGENVRCPNYRTH